MMQQSTPRHLYLELARTLVGSGKRLRLSMQGRSMMPLLHEPYILEISRVRGPLTIGDLIVFTAGSKEIVHRVVGFDRGTVIASGDAQPHVCERVAPADILGRVDTVWEGNAPEARRIDGPAFRLRGALLARLHPVRRLFVITRSLRTPRNRPRPFPAVCDLVREHLTGRSELFESKVAALSQPVVETVLRHRCAGFMATRTAPMPLRRALLGSRMNTIGLLNDATEVAGVLRARNIPLVLLKGAARLCTGGDEMLLHPSGDIDVLVPRELQQAAVQALLEHGHEHHPDSNKFDYKRHHHAAPLYRRGHRPVEVHRALSPEEFFRTPTAWSDLLPYLVQIEPGIYTLDPVMSAFHGAMHAAISLSLRDAVFLAATLREMTDEDRARVWQLARNEPADPIRAGGVLAFACSLARIPCDATPLERLYSRWMLRRDDLPAYLRDRSQLVDAAVLLCGGRVRQAWRVFSASSHGAAVIGRFATGVAALFYALLMKDIP